MATILAYTSPALGHLFPISAVLAELAGRGHHIAVRTLRAGVPAAQNLGFDAAPIADQIEAITLDDWKAPNPRAALAVAFDTFARRAEFEIDDVRAALDATRPDVVVVDANCWGAAVAAEAAGVPWLSFWPYIPYLPSRGVPPFGPGLAPRTGPVGALRDAVLRPVVTGGMEKLILPPTNAIRTRVGVPTLGSITEIVENPPLTLVATAEPFEYPRNNWAESVALIGPCAADPLPADEPDWLAAIDRPIVLASTSSERQHDTDLVTATIAALRDDPVHVVATLPAGIPAGLSDGPNVTVRQFVPHGAVLDRAVCAVTHGGMGVTQKALARGVPVCAVPHGRDQFEVARRVEVSGSGTRLPAKKLTVERLREQIRAAMTMSAGARRVADGFARAGGAPRGADLIEQRLLSRSGRPGS
ncbi:glycosyltransferase [Mycobacterium sp. Y57]|uniref:nucleotide disphospho-sugar-binding domain-containing protein n=1 Tax=Mycolicibacterium xanthum TaxID=2796469 RepID=UPI001C84D456|nr:nucleotide disphospho-sugar-binding domain-containing protein [Mycolicibacterium xanthum]MBX7435282.1 glycosyltransferase [Mycolicibacterium xanthum]